MKEQNQPREVEYVTLCGPNGMEDMEYIDDFPMGGKRYAVLLPETGSLVVIMEVKGKAGNRKLFHEDSMEIKQAVYQCFKEKYRHEFKRID